MRRRLALVPIGVALVIGLAAPAMAASTVTIDGTVHGNYAKPKAKPDAGQGYLLAGAGATNLGETGLTGTIGSPGLIRSAPCAGTLRLTTSRGTLSLVVKSAPVAGFSACPSAFSWVITSGTGGYAGSGGQGRLTLVLARSTFTIVFGSPVSQARSTRPTVVTLPFTGPDLPPALAVAGAVGFVLTGSVLARAARWKG